MPQSSHSLVNLTVPGKGRFPLFSAIPRRIYAIESA
jgi:hypothetical protein